MYPYSTYGDVGPASGGLQGVRRPAYGPNRIGYDQGGKGVNYSVNYAVQCNYARRTQ